MAFDGPTAKAAESPIRPEDLHPSRHSLPAECGVERLAFIPFSLITHEPQPI